MKNNIKLSLLGFAILLALLHFNIAKANVPFNLSTGIINLVSFVNINIVGKIRNDFCNNYVLSVSAGEWKANDFRIKIGQKFCVGYKISAINQKTGQTPIQNINNFSNLSKPNVLNNQVQNNYLPSPLIGETAGNGNKLNSNEIIYWTNIERSKNGFVSLNENNILTEIALSRVEDMLNNNYFAHISPSGDSVSKTAERDNYKYITIGENISLGNFDSSRDLVSAWMNSSGHRANILNKNYTQIGAAADEGMYQGKKVWISAQIFGRPLSDCILPDVATKNKISQYKTSALSLNSNLNNIQTEFKTINSSNTEIYNAKVSEYNSLARLFNNLVAEIKTLTTVYNQEVQIFNECIKTK